MTTATVDDLHSWIEKMMTSLSINDYKLDVSGNTVKGDGYLGEVTFLKVKTAKKDYELVVKSAKKSDQLRKQTPVKEAYDRETLFYSKIFPAFEEFQKERCVKKPFTNVPKCYSFSTELTKEAVILQNLKTQGFDLHDRQKAMNLQHILMVFQNYGRYHALSIAFRHKKPDIFKNLTKGMTDLFGRFITQMNMMDTFYKEFENLKKLLMKDKQTAALKKYEGFEKNFEKILVNFTDGSSNLSCLIHGDCWNNNFMFKYEGNDKANPAEMCFLDFQLVRVASPIIDLSYFFYCCGDKYALKNFDFVLQAYHSSLIEFLKELGCDPNIAFSYQELIEHWKEQGKYGLILCLFLLKIALCDSSEAPDLMESAESADGFKDSLEIKMGNQSLYDERIKCIYLHFAEKFL